MSWGVATQNGVSVSLASIVSLSCGATEFSPASLFTSGVTGAWYDPSDYTTLFQDSAGTTPVTAVEQPVGLMLDKSGNGNHASQATAASRPVLRARYNLLTYSEQFDNAAWNKSNATVTANAAVAPDGTTTADKFVENTALSDHYINSVLNTVITATQYTYSCYAKAAERTVFAVYISGATATGVTSFNLSTGAVIATSANAVSSIVDAGNGWYRCSVTVTTNSASSRVYIYPNTGGTVYQGDGTSGIYVWGADLRTGSSAGTYQRIGAATDYATAGFLPYLALDGTDDSFGTNSIDFSATDKMSVCAGVTKLSDATNGCILELNTSFATGSGVFALFTGNNTTAGPQYHFSSRGAAAAASGQAANSTTAFAAPITNVVTGQGDISGDLVSLRINGAANGTNGTADQGSGNYGNYPLYIGRRGNATFPVNGRIYQIVVCGKALSASELASTEAYVATKTGVTLPVPTFDFYTTANGDFIILDNGDNVVSPTYYA